MGNDNPRKNEGTRWAAAWVTVTGDRRTSTVEAEWQRGNSRCCGVPAAQMSVADLLSTWLFLNMRQLKRKKVLRNRGINIAASKA